MLKLAIKKLSHQIINIYASSLNRVFSTEKFNAPDRMCLLDLKRHKHDSSQKKKSYHHKQLKNLSEAVPPPLVPAICSSTGRRVTAVSKRQWASPKTAIHYHRIPSPTSSGSSTQPVPHRGMPDPPTSPAVPPPSESQNRPAPAGASARRSYCATALAQRRRGSEGLT